MKLLFITILFLLSSFAASCPNLNGTWKSSKEMSMAYNNEHAKIEKKQENLLNQILGYMEINITKNKVVELELPTIQVKANEKSYDFKFDRIEYSYKTVKCDENTITTEYDHPHAGKQTRIVHFVNKDTYWVSPEILPNTREYFVRTKN